MLDDFPVTWTSPDVREVLGILRTVYRPAEIDQIVNDAGLDPARIAFSDRADFTWRSVFEFAVGQGRLGPLLDTVAAARPQLKVRLDEVRSGTGAVTAVVTGPDLEGGTTWKNFSQDGQAEAIIVAGQPTFVDIAFLAKGLDKARSVCRLVTKFPGEGSGTAFRIGPRHLLTNYHVLFNPKDGDRKVVAVEAWFDYETDADGTLRPIVQVPCDVDSIVGEKADDWALLRTTKPVPQRYPALSLGGARVPQVDDRVYIIQHPQGQPKKIAFQHNLVRSVASDVLQYWTDTDLGSSGSPVFDENWDIVALHHFSVPAPAGEASTMRNQGRRIERVVERMKAAGAFPKD
jgi:V8-like Glu-specific endopeptidase